MYNRLTVMIVEDEALLSLDLEQTLVDAGLEVVGIAATEKQALSLAEARQPDLALVDIQLSDGPSGIRIARQLAVQGRTSVVFMTANTAMLPEDFAGAIGVIAKPYMTSGVNAALAYLEEGVLRPPPVRKKPASLELSKPYSKRWTTPAGHKC